jgi:hypothetical protein
MFRPTGIIVIDARPQKCQWTAQQALRKCPLCPSSRRVTPSAVPTRATLARLPPVLVAGASRPHELAASGRPGAAAGRSAPKLSAKKPGRETFFCGCAAAARPVCPQPPFFRERGAPPQRTPLRPPTAAVVRAPSHRTHGNPFLASVVDWTSKVKQPTGDVNQEAGNCTRPFIEVETRFHFYNRHWCGWFVVGAANGSVMAMRKRGGRRATKRGEIVGEGRGGDAKRASVGKG